MKKDEIEKGVYDKVIYLDFDGLHLLDGVVMAVEKATYTLGINEIKVTLQNNTLKTLIFGEDYYLVKKVNNKWQRVPASGDIGFNGIGYVSLPYGKANRTYQLHYTYNNLTAGTYRIVTRFFDDADIPVTLSDAYDLYAEISLTGDA